MFKFNIRNIRKWREIYSNLTINTPEPTKLHCPGVFVTLNIFILLFKASTSYRVGDNYITVKVKKKISSGLIINRLCHKLN